MVDETLSFEGTGLCAGGPESREEDVRGRGDGFEGLRPFRGVRINVGLKIGRGCGEGTSCDCVDCWMRR